MSLVRTLFPTLERGNTSELTTLILLITLVAIFTVGFYTSMSDRHGRKSLVFWTLLPALTTQALIIYMALPTVNLGVWALYVDALMMGLTGGGLLLDPSLTAYIGKEHRNYRARNHTFPPSRY